MYLQLAWRNIWRNPRRTTVILVAVIIGVWSMILLGALMRGTAVGMVKNGIATLTGHIQIHHKGYREDPAIENSMTRLRFVETLLNEKLPPAAVMVSKTFGNNRLSIMWPRSSTVSRNSPSVALRFTFPAPCSLDLS